eukprot:7107858-Prymnesium_polylepis.1
MRCKLKTIVGFYQCIAAAPSVFNVVAPSGLEEYTGSVGHIDLPADFGLDLVVRATCFGQACAESRIVEESTSLVPR